MNSDGEQMVLALKVNDLIKLILFLVSQNESQRV